MTKPKLLLADDSLTIRKVVELTFADEGIDVSTAADAESAMQRFVELQPDIVLVDVGLEGTSGYQICEMIKADDATKHIPVMLLVGSFEPFDHDEAHRVGADGFLTKPFNSIRDLVGRIRMLLEHDSEPEARVPSSEIVGDQNSSTDFDTQKSPPSTPETEDIDHLYQSSFGTTAGIGESEAADDLLGDAGMDDEMIEASRSAPQHKVGDLSTVGERVEQTKEFDWSLESMVIDNSSAAEPENTTVDEVPETEDLETVASNESPDDENEILENVFDSIDDLEMNDSSSTTHGDVATLDTIEISHAPDFVVNFRAPTTDLVEDREEVIELPGNDEDWTGDDSNLDAGERGRDDPLSFADVDPAIHETIPYEIGEQPPVTLLDADPSGISPDLIDKIVERVIERLSDSVVREIARVEVPRITEKLIREALKQENKA